MMANFPPPIEPGSKIYKLPLPGPPPSSISSKKLSWGKGSNAKFHFTVFAYVSPETESAAAEEVENLKRSAAHDHHHHNHGHHHHDHKDDSKKRGELLQERAKRFESILEQLTEKPKKKPVSAKNETHAVAKEVEETKTGKSKEAESKPVKRRISSSRDYDEKPFEMRVGLGFSVPCLEKCVKTMKVGERAKFLCLPEECEGYAQLESVLRQEKRNKELIAKGEPPMKMFGCCAHARAEDAEANKDILYLVNSPLEFEIELVSVQEPGDFVKELWEMTPEEKYKEAPVRKEEGTALYRQGDYEGACEKYTRALMLLESLSLSPAVTDVLRNRKQAEEAAAKENRKRLDEIRRLQRLGQPIPEKLREQEEVKYHPADVVKEGGVDPNKVFELMNITRLNYAATKLKLGDLPTVVAQCTEVLKTDTNNVKALFRRAQARAKIGRDLDLAAQDLDTLRAVFAAKNIPETGAEWVELKREEQNLQKLLKASEAKERKMYSNMFG
ncbi:hypothetical protein HDU96_008443 [Phlyctochytrium bullatum]|nr:hypothetical protein HDU96_008443 [Phlyctochytrium bullatum]